MLMYDIDFVNKKICVYQSVEISQWLDITAGKKMTHL